MRFDLAQLDSVATYFHLMIDPADEMNGAALVSAHQITGAIHAAVSSKRVGQKAFRRQLWSFEVAARHAVAANEEFSRLSCRDRPPCMIENIELRIRNRRAQGHDTVRLLADRHRGRPDGGLCRTVHILDCGVRRAPQFMHQRRLQGFTANEQMTRAPESLAGIFVDQKHRGH